MTNAWLGMGNDTLETGGSVPSYNREVIRNGLKRLLRTQPGEYAPDPNMGNMAWRYLHRPLNAGVLIIIAYSCLECLARYDDRVQVNLEGDMPSAYLDEENGEISLELEFTWADTQQRDVLGVKFPLALGGDDIEFN